MPRDCPTGPSRATTAQKISLQAAPPPPVAHLAVPPRLGDPGAARRSFAVLCGQVLVTSVKAALDETQAKMYTHLCLNELCLVLESRRSPGIAAAFRRCAAAKGACPGIAAAMPVGHTTPFPAFHPIRFAHGNGSVRPQTDVLRGSSGASPSVCPRPTLRGDTYYVAVATTKTLLEEGTALWGSWWSPA